MDKSNEQMDKHMYIYIYIYICTVDLYVPFERYLLSTIQKERPA